MKAAAKRVAYEYGRQALFTTPVPLNELGAPPAAMVAELKAQIETEYAPLLEAPDRDMRRIMRVDRKVQLNKAERWTPVTRTEYLNEAWTAPPGDAYVRLVGEAQDDLARRIAVAVVAGD